MTCRLVTGAVPYALLLAVFAPALAWMYGGWMLETGYYSHGPLMVLAAAVALWRRRREIVAAPRQPSPLAVLPLALALLLHVAGQSLLVDTLSGVALVPALMALVWAADGGPRLRLAAPGLGCLFFAVPLPIFVSGELAYVLKHQATSVAVALGNLFGLGLEQHGANILVPGQAQPLVVGDACSGLRSLAALLALGYVYAFLFARRPWPLRLTILVLAGPVAIVANFLRIAGLAAVAKRWGVAFASGPAHEWSGFVVYLLAIVMLVVLDRLLPGQSAPAAPAAKSEPGPAPAPAVAARARRLALACVLVLGTPALILAAVGPAETGPSCAARLPKSSQSFVMTAELELPEAWYDLLGTRDVGWRRYEPVGGGRPVFLTAIFQGARWKSLHPPQVCLISSGFEIWLESRRTIDLQGQPVEVAVLEAGDGRHRYLIGYVFGGEGFTTPSFLGFFWRSLPRALLRRSGSGFLLRADVPFDQDGRAAAEATLDRFLGELLPAAGEAARR